MSELKASVQLADRAPVPRLLDLHPRDWPDFFAQHLGVAAFQGLNAARWVFQRNAHNWHDMTDLPVALRERLQIEQPILTATVEAVSRAQDGAVKLLLRYPDGATVEAVGMPGSMGRTLCLSTQVGCAVRCAFCASGLEGVARNLSRAEILEQVIWLRHEQGQFQRLVIMGMGEPGHNLEAVLAALESLLDPEGMNLAARRITLSTVAPKGVLPRLAAWGREIKLALSVHAPDDALRHKLVPGVRKRSLAETLQEAELLFRSTGREYTIEYVLLREVNDRPEHAVALAKLLRGHRCHVNLIPYNPVSELDFRRPSDPDQKRFANLLMQSGLPVTLRNSLGSSRDAACGQLRRRSSEPPPSTISC
jgi:23S rRNA (adenine2503-C2)-methyltransferase